jgi:tetratricopeptide (TPR) repeat protein
MRGVFRMHCWYLGEAIQAKPDEPDAYLELALAEGAQVGRKTESLRAIDRALALAPTSARILGYKGYLLSHYGKHREALELARQAEQMDPFCYSALLARANAHTKLAQWSDAERAARRMLEVFPGDMGGMNLLAQAVRLQGRSKESKEIVRQILARVPNDAFGHTNAGYEALKTGDYQRAMHHFLQTLRQEPTHEHARLGLMQALRSRSPVYRFVFLLLTPIMEMGEKLGRILGILCVLTFGFLLAPVVLYLAMAFTIQPISNLFLLFDPLGRKALSKKERGWAYFVGALFFILLLVLALAKLTPALILFGGYFALLGASALFAQQLEARRARREKLAAVSA